MFRITSESELLESFRNLDRAEVTVPAELEFPLVVRDYLTWAEPSGHRVFLVFSEGSKRAPQGVVFKRDSSSGGAPETGVAAMCQWCHAVRGGNAVGLLTASSSANRRVGISICRDLSCKEKAQGTPGPHDFRQSGDGRGRVQLIIKAMAEFSRQNLF